MSVPQILLLSTADWNTPLWTNKQHVARVLSAEFPVLYVNSVGLRRPRLDLTDLRRVARRVTGSAKRGTSPVPPGITVISPHVAPWHGRAGIDRINRIMLRRQVGSWRASAQPVLWTYSPVTFGLERFAHKVVYHCVDFLGAQEGVDAGLITRSEQRLVPRADLVLASSRPLLDHVTALGAKSTGLVENVADVDLMGAWSPDGARDGVVFAGNLTADKVDFALLLRLVRESDVTLHLAGPVDHDEAARHPDLAVLLGHPRVTYHGSLRPPELARLLQCCTVGLIPYRVNAYTQGVFPMKVYEYLAAGLAVVSTPLPSLVGNTSVMTSAEDEFVSSVLRQIPATDAVRQERRTAAQAHSWRRRGEELRALLRDLVAGGGA